MVSIAILYLFCVSQAVSGLPAILVYKKGEVIGNFVRLTDEFGNDMYPADIESFLIEYVYLWISHLRSLISSFRSLIYRNK